MNFTKEKIIGGTLIEFLDNQDFYKEWDRSTITDFTISSKDGIEITGDGEAFYSYPDLKTAMICELDGVFYIRHCNGYFKICYAVIPKDIAVKNPFKAKVDYYKDEFISIIEFISNT